MLIVHTSCGPYIRTNHRDTVHEFMDLCNGLVKENTPFLEIYGSYMSNAFKTMAININSIVSVEKE